MLSKFLTRVSNYLPIFYLDNIYLVGFYLDNLDKLDNFQKNKNRENFHDLIYIIVIPVLALAETSCFVPVR